MIDYNGNRDLDTFIKFLDNGGVLPDEEEDEEDEEEMEDSTKDQDSNNKV